MNLQDLENFVDHDGEIDIEDGDFGIVITAEGKLKMLLLPDDIDDAEDVPDVLAKIISLFDQDKFNIPSRMIH